MPEPATIQDYLSADHQRLDRLLAEAMSDAGGIRPEPFAQFRVGLLRHIGIEEKLLFPAARKQAARGSPPATDRLRADHARLAAFLVPTPTRAIAEEIQRILGPHNAIEEGPAGVYLACQTLLGDQAPALLQAAITTPNVRVRPHQDRIVPAGSKSP